MENENKEVNTGANQSGNKTIEPVITANPMQATNSPHMPTKMEFSQKQTEKNDNSSQEDESK